MRSESRITQEALALAPLPQLGANGITPPRCTYLRHETLELTVERSISEVEVRQSVEQAVNVALKT